MLPVQLAYLMLVNVPCPFPFVIKSQGTRDEGRGTRDEGREHNKTNTNGMLLSLSLSLSLSHIYIQNSPILGYVHEIENSHVYTINLIVIRPRVCVFSADHVRTRTLALLMCVLKLSSLDP